MRCGGARPRSEALRRQLGDHRRVVRGPQPRRGAVLRVSTDDPAAAGQLWTLTDLGAPEGSGTHRTRYAVTNVDTGEQLAVSEDTSAVLMDAPADVADVNHYDADTRARGVAIFRLAPDGESLSYRLIVANIQDVTMAHIHLSWLDPHKMRRMTVIGSERMVVFDDMELDDQPHTYRIEFAGETHAYYPGLMYSLAPDGKDLQTSDGAGGLKWGHAHRWVEGEPYDVALVVAIQHTPGSDETFDECMADPDMERVYIDDPLSPDERAWLKDVTFRRAVDPGSVTEAERRRAHTLYARGPQVGLFLGDHLCALPDAEGQNATP